MSDNNHRQAKTEQNKFWLQNNVNDILEPMMMAVCSPQNADADGNKPKNEVSLPFHQLLCLQLEA